MALTKSVFLVLAFVVLASAQLDKIAYSECKSKI